MKLPSISLRGGAAVTVSALLAATALAAMAPSQALDSTGVGPRDSTRAGLPAYYTDDSGVALQLCVDGTARCGGATLRSDGAGGPGVAVGPDGEGFYWTATTSLSGAGFDIDIEFAAEAAWMSRTQPMTFDRVRIRGTSTIGNLDVETPYGVFTVEAGPAAARNINMTEDIGCAIAPCDFRRMTTNPLAHITSWITSTTRPAGYLGNAATSGPATVGIGGPSAIASVGTVSTNEWVVMGKLAPPNRVSLPNTLNFGNAARVSTRSVTMKNLGTNARTISGVTLKGSRNFTKLASSTCKAGLVLGVGKSCKVDVRFRPVRPSTATLTITDNIGAHHVALKGR